MRYMKTFESVNFNIFDSIKELEYILLDEGVIVQDVYITRGKEGAEKISILLTLKFRFPLDSFVLKSISK